MPAHALIIDDDEFSLEVLAELLYAEDVTSTTVQNPAQIDEILAQIEYLDVIFLDLGMPKIDGYEMLDILRNDFHINVPIVAYTVNANEINAAREFGFDSFIGKPLEMDRFGDQLRRILNGQGVWDAN